jgi:putative molybdopterin biosynthesis protein
VPTPKRNVYLEMQSLGDARRVMFDAFRSLPSPATETIPVPDAVGRVLSRPVSARISSPNYHSAAMDGIAVKAADTFGVREDCPKALTVGRDAVYVNTGHILPEGANAVIMIENVQVIDETTLKIEAPAFPWQNVRKLGEDIVATELLFARHEEITPYAVGALLSGGVYEVPVYQKPRVLIIPTGSELVNWQTTAPEDLKPGQVLETNSVVLGKLVEQSGGIYERHRAVMDDLAEIQAAVQAAVAGDYQMVLTIGGSSAGSEDYAKPVVSALGEVLVHGVTIMPGKPVLVGKVAEKPVFGMPGYPVSTIIAFEQFVQPLIYQMLGQEAPQRVTVPVQPTRKLASKLGVEEFLRVKLGQVGGRIAATPLPRGAGVITSITEADGIIRIPAHVDGLKDDEPIQAELLKPATAIRNTLVAVGSHDNTLDILADELRAKSRLSLSSSHVGSMGGLMAIKRGGCHLAGAHLLDTQDGSYNISYVKRYLADTPVRLVNLVLRDQGLIIPKGNPKGIKGIEDLAREELSFINRQGGSGTRILLDYRLNQLGLRIDRINGYQNEEFTHMAVAAAVLSGAADLGLGINAAARALDLDFIPVVTEQYDLVIPADIFETEMIQTVLEIISGKGFQDRVMALGGYSTEHTGTVWEVR